MPTLLLRFPGGRYHATPWGHHVNEGLVEWPPSPWRILRALIACGYATQGWSEIPPAGRRLLESLAETLPRYRLPPTTVAHSRHFMPTGVFDKGREKTTLVFDSWAEIGDGVLAICWDHELDEEASALLATLAEHLGYLGRSESWVEASLSRDDAELPPGSDAYPHVDGHHGKPGFEQVSVMAAEPAGAYREWRDQSVASALAASPLPDGKRPSTKLMRERAAAVEPYPVDLINCLERDTAWWKHHRWTQPPGSRRVLYWRRSDALTIAAPAPITRMTRAKITTVLLALTTPSGSRSALPLVGRALPQAELLHRALVARVGGGDRVPCPELTGKDAAGKPLTGHRHAHVLPIDLDGDGHLDHVVVHAPMGFGAAAQLALRSLTRTWTKGGVGELRVAIAAQGDLDDLRTLPTPLNSGIRALLGPSSGARTWKSCAPLVFPRHAKPRGANTLDGQIQSELASRGLPPAAVELLRWDESNRHLRHAVRVRRSPARRPPIDAGFAIQLVFERPVRGPISLGYGAHFGLGLFTAAEEALD